MIITSALPETAFTATYDEANRLSTIVLNGETFTLTYDENGALASKSGPASGTTTYTWSARGQLAQIAGPGVAANFRYDAFGRRIERTVNGQTTGYLYDGAQAIAELKGSALDTVYHTGIAIDEVLARYAPSGNRTLLTDALQSVIAQAADDQSVQNFYAYSPYGEAQTLGPDEGNPIQYTGRENDGTGLYYYRARYYDPVLKRFISEDPIGIAGGANFYAYVGGNPISKVDPSGLILSPNFLMQFLPAPVINGLVNVASRYPAPVAASALISALQAYQYTVAINLMTAGAVSAASVAAAGYLGYQFGATINREIEKAYGQNAGGALYELLYGDVESNMLRAPAEVPAQHCRP